MKSDKNKKLTFWQKIHKYRAKIGLLAFIIIIPISLILIAYLGPYFSNKSVHFDEDYEDVQRHFVGLDDLDEMLLTIEWTNLVKPQFDENGEVTTDGYYRFSLTYEEKDNYDISAVSITPVLHPEWFPIYSIGSTRAMYNTTLNFQVTFNEVMPLHKLLFINVEQPNLYLKIEYSYVVGDETLDDIAYVIYSLDGLYPTDSVS